MGSGRLPSLQCTALTVRKSNSNYSTYEHTSNSNNSTYGHTSKRTVLPVIMQYTFYCSLRQVQGKSRPSRVCELSMVLYKVGLGAQNTKKRG